MQPTEEAIDMKRTIKRFLGFFLCLALLLPMLPANVLAADEEIRQRYS